ncbi:MAG: alkaline phosphatase family protein [Acidobacteria bacterium]|nr:alkaline phosphatase family protein [Acidobacteriota bacterium]
MATRVYLVLLGMTLLLLLPTIPCSLPSQADLSQKGRRNVIIFVADGLRPGSVNAEDAPTLSALRERGVNFVNSHALFPTFTTPNSATIATSHYLGDTGDFGNILYAGYPLFNTGNFGKSAGTITPSIESDQTLSDLNDHYKGNYLSETTLLQLARQNGYNTATVGKHGPAAIQDVSQLAPLGSTFPLPRTVFIDDATGSATGIPLSHEVITALTTAGLPAVAPDRSNGCGPSDPCNNGFAGNNTTPGTTSANIVQQKYFVDAVTKAILPLFISTGKPFALVFWSRDADGTQHNQGDSLNSLTPGINGPASRAAVRNADGNLKQILDYVNSNSGLASNTDIFVTADHGSATISRHEVDRQGHFTKSYAAQFTYKDARGRVEVNPGFLPPGFLAIDLAHSLGMSLHDPDSMIPDSAGRNIYLPVDPTIGQQTGTAKQRPAAGNGLIGASGRILDSTDAKAIVAANGGSDLIYVPDHNCDRVRRIVQFLAQQDYVGGIFVDDRCGTLPGALPLSSINLVGATPLPTPTIALSFKTFYLTPGDLQSAVQIADTVLQEGQGMHRSLGRDNTFNNMAAIGPDFKTRFVDFSPVSNADIALTLAHIMELPLPSRGNLRGRVLREALKGGPKEVAFEKHRLASQDASSGMSTVLLYQQAGKQLYFDEACFVGGERRDRNPCR